MRFCLAFFFVAMSLVAVAQTDTTTRELSAKEQQKVMKSLGIDSVKIIGEFGELACKCIDSISVTGINSAESSKKIAACIDRQVESLDLTITLMQSMQSGSKKIEISLNNNKKSDRYTNTYRLLEKWLRDSCNALARKVAVDNSEGEHSFSKDRSAIAEYNNGIEKLDAEKYAEAIPFFEVAVKIDPQFVFAWDNIGVCSRKAGFLEKALNAYQHSLAIEPKGVTALQNIPIVYEYMKEYDKAIESYKNIEKIYPDNPESFFGAGRIYFSYKDDLEKGLDQLCKAYNMYIKMESPYRVDAEKLIGSIFRELKKQNKEDVFNKILKDNNISVSK